MKTVYFTRPIYTTGTQDWLHCKEVIQKMGGFVCVTGPDDNLVKTFYPTHMIQKIDYD